MDKLSKKTLVIAPLACYVLGLCVHNTYLNFLGLSEFDVARARYIYAGATFIILCLIAFISVTWNWGINPPKFSLRSADFLGWATRALVIIIAASWIIDTPDIVFEKLLGWCAQDKYVAFVELMFILYWFILFSLMVIMSVREDSESSRALDKELKHLYAWSFVLLAPIGIAFSIYCPPFLGLILMAAAFAYFMKTGAQYQEILTSGPGAPIDGVSALPKGTVSLKLEQYYNWLHDAVLAIVFVFFLILIYSLFLYPHIPVSFGGARPVHIELTYQGRRTPGWLLDESSTWMTFRPDKKDAVYRFKTADVEKLKIYPTKEKSLPALILKYGFQQGAK